MAPYKLPIDPAAKPVDNHGLGPDPNFIGRVFEELGQRDREDENLDPNLTALASPGDAFEHGGAGRERDYCPRCDTYHTERKCPVKPIPVPKAMVELIPTYLAGDYKTQTVGEHCIDGKVRYRHELIRLSDGTILAWLGSAGVVHWADKDMFTTRQRITLRKALSDEKRRWWEESSRQAKAEASRAAIPSREWRKVDYIVPTVLPVVASSISEGGTMPAEALEGRRCPQTCTCPQCRPDLYPRPTRYAGVPIYTVDDLQEPR